ncbi:glyoxalase superfamily protein [bacterium]|nr:glyoxalase superfamily protein [bacterium]
MSKKASEIYFGRVMPVIEVSDIQKSHDFYVDIFGFEKVFENGEPVGVMVLKKDNAEFMISLNKNHKGGASNAFHMFVSHVNSMYDICVKNKIRIIKGLKDQPYGQRAFVFSDIDGNRIDVGEEI